MTTASLRPRRSHKSRTLYPAENRNGGRERHCRACGQWKPRTDFSATLYVCIACQTERRAERKRIKQLEKVNDQ